MTNKYGKFLIAVLVVAIIIAFTWLLNGLPAQAEVYTLTAADSTDKVFDTYIQGGSHPSIKYKNYGSPGYTFAGWFNDANNYYMYTLVDFDISGFPATVEDVDSAIFFGVAYEIRTSWRNAEYDTLGYDSASVEVNQILVQWGEGVGNGATATSGECSYMDSASTDDWNSQGCNGANTDIDATPTGWQLLELDGDVGNYIDTLYIDVTDDVKDMLADPVHPNEYAGWKITPVGFTPGEDHISTYLNFFSKEAAEIHDAKKWKLMIYYTSVVAQNRRRPILTGEINQ